MNPPETAPKRSQEAGAMQLEKGVQREYSIHQQELELQRKEQEGRARQQQVQIKLLGKQTEQQVQISQVLMTVTQNLVKK